MMKADTLIHPESPTFKCDKLTEEEEKDENFFSVKRWQDKPTEAQMEYLKANEELWNHYVKAKMHDAKGNEIKLEEMKDVICPDACQSAKLEQKEQLTDGTVIDSLHVSWRSVKEKAMKPDAIDKPPFVSNSLSS